MDTLYQYLRLLVKYCQFWSSIDRDTALAIIGIIYVLDSVILSSSKHIINTVDGF